MITWIVFRTSYIAYITSVNYVISLFGPSLASVTMARSIWLPFYLSIAFFAAALPVTYSLPTTISPYRSGDSRTASTQDSIHEAESLLSPANESSTVSSRKSSKSLFQRVLAPLRTLIHLVVGRRNFQTHLIGGFLLPALASSNTHLLPQYTSKRYGWKFEHVGYLLSVKAAVNITLLALVIPTTMRVLLKRMPGREVRLNYRGAQASLAVSILGALSISAAGTVGALMCGKSTFRRRLLPVFLSWLCRTEVIRPTRVRLAYHIVGSPDNLCSWIRPAGLHDVTGRIRAYCSLINDIGFYSIRPVT